MKRSWFRALLLRRVQVLRSVVHIISGFLVLYIISKKDKGANKVIWIFLILLFPLFGSLLYILYNFQASTRKFEQKIFQIGQKNRTLYGLPGSAEKSAYYEAPAHIPQIRYLKYAGFPVYDNIGCFLALPKDYAMQLKNIGIKCEVFNPFRPVLTDIQNNRDHRKITIIDGKVAFTGGLNLSDEYINTYEKHGYWKDAVIQIKGKAAWYLHCA